jgi:hypothetical protein
VSDWTSPDFRQHARALWFGVLAGPVGWGVHLLASYLLASLTCLRAWPGFTLLGFSGGQAIMLVFTMAVEAVIAVAGVLAYQRWQRLRAAAGWRGTHFTTWMAASGVLLSGMFFVAVLFAGLPMVLLQCG